MPVTAPSVAQNNKRRRAPFPYAIHSRMKLPATFAFEKTYAHKRVKAPEAMLKYSPHLTIGMLYAMETAEAPRPNKTGRPIMRKAMRYLMVFYEMSKRLIIQFFVKVNKLFPFVNNLFMDNRSYP